MKRSVIWKRNRLWKGIPVIFLILAMFLGACSDGGNSSEGQQNDPVATDRGGGGSMNTPDASQDADPGSGEGAAGLPPLPEEWKNVSGEITMWAFNENVFEEIADAFMQEYPNIKVNAVFVPFGDLHDRLQTTLAAGTGAPDVAEVEQGQFTRYSVGNVLEDLLQPEYNAQQYREFIADFNWERWKSPDGTQLLGMPWDSTPGVYYYRSDVFDELGLPSDPEELGEYIKDGENYLQIVQVLSANGKMAMEWRDGPIHWAGDEIGYFDDDLNWVRDNDRLIEMLDYTKRGNQLGWAPHDSIFSDTGKQLVKNGDLVGVALGSWGARDIAANFPELEGKWRVTNLPFDINFPIGGSSFVIPNQSPNKEAAWVFIQWCMRSENAWKIWTSYSIQPGYSDVAALDWYAEQENAYLGGQKDYQLYEELAKKMPTKRLNPLDGRGWEIWLPRILDALDKNIDSRTTLQLVIEDVENILGPDIEELRKDLQQ